MCVCALILMYTHTHTESHKHVCLRVSGRAYVIHVDNVEYEK